jgi:hypothetical protein
MKLDKVSVVTPIRYFEKPPRVMYESKNGYDIDAMPLGVLVTRLPGCKVQIDREEPDVVLIPWSQVSEPCSVAKEQPKK